MSVENGSRGSMGTEHINTRALRVNDWFATRKSIECFPDQREFALILEHDLISRTRQGPATPPSRDSGVNSHKGHIIHAFDECGRAPGAWMDP